MADHDYTATITNLYTDSTDETDWLELINDAPELGTSRKAVTIIGHTEPLPVERDEVGRIVYLIESLHVGIDDPFQGISPGSKRLATLDLAPPVTGTTTWLEVHRPDLVDVCQACGKDTLAVIAAHVEYWVSQCVNCGAEWTHDNADLSGKATQRIAAT